MAENASPEGEVPTPPERLHSDSSVSLTAGLENPSIIGERDSEYVLDHEGHHRYLRLGRALLYLKEPLHEPVQSEIEKLHKKLLEEIQEIQKKQKTKNGSNKEKKKILNDYLKSKCLNEKVDENNKIYITNVNIEKWESHPWETGKAFMPSGQMEKNSCPQDTDIMGILRLISSCKQFNAWMNPGADNMSGHTKIQEVLKVRNLVAHSNSLCCSEEEMKNGIEQIKILLEHMKQKFESFADEEDFSKDEKRIYQRAEEKMEGALCSIEKVMTDTDFDVMRELVVMDICKSRAYESSDETHRKKIAKVQLRYETRRIFIVLNDLYKNRSKDFKERLQNQDALQSFIIEAKPDDVQFLLAALEEKKMFQAENLDALLQVIEPLEKENDFRRIKRKMMEIKKSLERTSAIASATIYDVLILHCEADRNEAISFRQHKLDILKDLNPPAKTILYDEYVVSGTSHVSALDYVLDDCRLVFILCTQSLVQNNLSKFQAEIVKCNSLQKNEGPRVIPVYLMEEDFQCAPSWIRVMTPIHAWKEYAQTSLMNTLRNGRKKYLKSPP
ncbi:hypothetical protein CHS0354_041520 [Potamilus streckersoni]|nr:hypothetical protein CHS0354_041520 [Potamilus streckersoni]